MIVNDAAKMHEAVRSVVCPASGCGSMKGYPCRKWGQIRESDHSARERKAAKENPELFMKLDIEWYLDDILNRYHPKS
jgi:hypothetical protein